MKISKIVIDQILGVEHLEIVPGRVTVISGRNGVGKTSVLDSIRAALGGGKDATLIRRGATEGKTVIVLDNGQEVVRKIRKDSTSLDVIEESAGVRMAVTTKPADWIKKNVVDFGLNPLEFMKANAKERTTILLGAMPMKLELSQVQSLVDSCIASINIGEHPMRLIAAIHKDLFDQRTNINREAKEKRATADQVMKTVPEAPADFDWAAERDRLITEGSALATEKMSAVSLVSRERDHDLKALVDEYEQTSKDIERIYAESIRALEAERDLKISNRRADVEADKALIVSAMTSKQTQVGESFDPKLQELREQLALARQNAEQQTRSIEVRKTADQIAENATALEARSEALSSKLAEVEQIKVDLLKNLPIQGIEVLDGEITVDGLPFDRVNEARRVQLAIEIAKLKAGGIPVVCVDGIECLDSANFEAFRVAAENADVQLIVTRVSDEAELKIEVQG